MMRRRVYTTQGGDLVHWTGELQQPDTHHTYRFHFDAVNVHNKLSMGPCSVCNVATASMPLKLCLYLVTCAETNAHLMYMHHHKLSSEQYNHADFEADLERELLQCALEDGPVSEEAGLRARPIVMVLLLGPRTRGLPHSRSTLSHTSKVSTASAWCVMTG
jgi:hypothetical protein